MEKQTFRPYPGALLNPRLDIVFKSIFTQESEDGRIARNSLISSLTGLKINETTLLNNDIPIEHSIKEKQIRLDVHCKTDNGERVDVEIQMQQGNINIPNRLEYYAARLLSSAEKIDDDYQQIHRVFQIMICDFTLESTTKEPLLLHTIRNQHGQSFGNLLNIITLELTKIKLPKKDIEQISDEKLEIWYENLTSAEKWGIFLKWVDNPKKNKRLAKLFDNTHGTKNARRILMYVSQSEKDWAMAESRRKFVMDYVSEHNAAIRKGEEIGLKRGIKQGKELGYKKAQAEIAALKARIAELEGTIN